MNILDKLPKPFFVLAPMDDVTDTVFRQIVASCQPPDLFFTEFTNVDGLQSPGRAKLIGRLRFTASEAPLIAQIWGKDPLNFYKTASQLADGSLATELGLPKGLNFSGIDINMGCPDKTIVKNGSCSALINNRDLASDIIQATQEGAAGKLPVSVKTRIGFSSIDLTWIEFLLQHHLDMLTIHARTRKEMSKVPAHWEVFSDITKKREQISPTTKVVGNGDILSRQQGRKLAIKYGLDGIMIGRGVFENPFVFSETNSWPGFSQLQRISLFARQIELFMSTWGENGRPVVVLNKFCKIYIQGFSGAKELRQELMRSQSTSELLDRLLAVKNDVVLSK